jgi:hypothetical protein
MSPFDVGVAAIIFGTLSGTILGVMRMRYRHLEQRENSRGYDAGLLEDRLTRIEQAVDAIAIEVERMSESQRFTSALLADRLPPRTAGRAIEGGQS